MNTRMIIKTLGKVLQMTAILMLIPAVCSLIYRETTVALDFVITALIFFIPGQLMALIKTRHNNIYSREGIVIAGLSWILLSLIGAVPYVLTGVSSYIDGLFTCVSGLTTTGAAVLAYPELLPRGLLFWSCFSHWIGGMGVLVLIMAVIPLAGKNSMHIMRAEVPGHQVGKLVPKMRKTALILYGIYFILTLLLVILLKAGGMGLYDSILHAFSTAGTGGFSTRSASIGAYDRVYYDVVVFIFMVLFGVNFNIYYLILLRKLRTVFKSEELRTYIGIVIVAMIAIAINISGMYGGFFKGLRYSSFQVGSIISTTGFTTADFGTWPTFSKTILVLLMICGASAGSTGGGIKVSRVIILFRSALREIKKALHPRSLNVVRLESKILAEEAVSSVSLYFVIYMMIMFLSVILISFNGFDPVSTVTSVISCFNNVGPYLSETTALGTYADFSAFSKIVLCLNMLAGRLEIFPLIILFSPALWKRYG